MQPAGALSFELLLNLQPKVGKHALMTSTHKAARFAILRVNKSLPQ